jgi:hypothetical protein
VPAIAAISSSRTASDQARSSSTDRVAAPSPCPSTLLAIRGGAGGRCEGAPTGYSEKVGTRGARGMRGRIKSSAGIAPPSGHDVSLTR